MDSAGDWCLLESDPGVFTLLIKKIGVKGVQVEELWIIDEGICKSLRPVHGLIFLFKYLRNKGRTQPVSKGEHSDNVFFAKQVINNACATQAVINILLNCEHPDVKLGPELTALKEFSMSFDPQMRGLTISNSETIRSVHNSMAQQALFEFDSNAITIDDDAYHFIGYMPINGRVYELDGLQDNAIDHGAIPATKDWLDIVRPIITDRINAYNDGEIHFNLMAIVSDRKKIYQRQLQDLMNETRLISIQATDAEIEMENLKMLIEYEDVKMEKYEQEMSRRRHNYLPFIIKLLQILAEEKKLLPLFDKYKKRPKKGPKRARVSDF